MGLILKNKGFIYLSMVVVLLTLLARGIISTPQFIARAAGNFNFVGPKDTVGWPHRIVFDTTRSGRVYAGSDDTMGLFKSDDSGVTWSSVTSYDGNNARSAWALDVDTTGRIYAGDFYGLGIRVSNDGGATFTTGNGLDPNFSYVSAVSASKDAARPNAAYLSIGIDRGADGQGGTGTPLKERGALYKTIDGGSNWTLITTAPTNKEYETVWVHPQNADLILAGKAIAFTANDPSSIMRSSDGGVTWTRGATPADKYILGAKDFTSSALTPNRIVASVLIYTLSSGKFSYEIWKSEDLGVSWNPTNAPILTNYFYYSVVASNTEDKYFAFSLPSTGGAPGVVVSQNSGGSSWSTITSAPKTSAYFTGAFNPASPSEILVGTLGDGVYKYNGTTWTQSSQGMSGALCDSISATATKMLIGCGNISFDMVIAYSNDQGASWNRVRLPGMDLVNIFDIPKVTIPVLIDKNQTATFLAGGPVMKRSDNAGTDWVDVSGTQATDSFAQGPDGAIYSAGYTNQVFRSVDHGQSFTQYGGLLSCNTAVFLRADPVTNGRVYATCVNSGNVPDGFWVTTGGSWTKLSTTGLPTNEENFDLAIDKNANTNLAVVTQKENKDANGSLLSYGSHVFVSTTSGSSWQDVTANINSAVPNALSNCVAAKAVTYLSDRAGHLAVGTDSSDVLCPQVNGKILESFDNGTTWIDNTSDLTPSHVWNRALFENPNEVGGLFVSTWYKGLYQRAALVLPTPTPTPIATPTPTPAPSKRVFISSASYNGNLGGLTGADSKCQQLADSRSLGGTWKAWLSSSTVSTASRLTHNNGQYKLLNNTVIANNWNDLTDGTILGQIATTEANNSLTNKKVWTNTKIDGGIYASNRSCSNWASSSSGIQGRQGDNTSTTTSWTSQADNACNASRNLYCFEQ